jgi:hypothetical protein
MARPAGVSPMIRAPPLSKVVYPMISARLEQDDGQASFRIDRRKVRTFVTIARRTSKCKVRFVVCSPMLTSNDMLDLIRKEFIGFKDMAILATAAGTLSDAFSEFSVHDESCGRRGKNAARLRLQNRNELTGRHQSVVLVAFLRCNLPFSIAICQIIQPFLDLRIRTKRDDVLCGFPSQSPPDLVKKQFEHRHLLFHARSITRFCPAESRYFENNRLIEYTVACRCTAAIDSSSGIFFGQTSTQFPTLLQSVTPPSSISVSSRSFFSAAPVG